MELTRLPKTSIPFDDDATAPEHEPLPIGYFGRGRGPLVLTGILGLVLFLSPWIAITMPDTFTLRGFDLGRRVGWVWGAGVAFAFLIPTALSRRTIVAMRGARLAAICLAAVPTITVVVLLLRPPHPAYLPLRFHFLPAFWATLVLSLCAQWFAFRFGGKIEPAKVDAHTNIGGALH